MKTKLQLNFYLILIFLLFPKLASCAPKSELIAFWNYSDEKNETKIDHSEWQDFLSKYVQFHKASSMNLIAYKNVKKEDKEKLSGYIKSLENLDPRKLSKREQKPYWINLYNALTVKIILDNYPVKSITKIYSGWFGFGPWNDKYLKIAGQDLTLNNIEHGILRPIFNDYRIHFAINCASIGCPDLSSTAYTAENIEKQLNQSGKKFLSQSKGLRFVKGELNLSSIFHWFKDDFGKNDKQLYIELSKFATKEDAKKLSTYEGDFDHDYDWDLNELK